MHKCTKKNAILFIAEELIGHLSKQNPYLAILFNTAKIQNPLNLHKNDLE